MVNRLKSEGEASGALAGRTALVTGAARRIGRALVLAVASAGARVVIHYHQSAAEADSLAAEIGSPGCEALLVSGDLADPALPATLFTAAREQSGAAVDILINNASLFEQGSAHDTSAAQWQRHQDVNVRAPFLLSQAFARQLPPDTNGDIVNLNDFRALRPGPDHFAYTLSKVGLHGLTHSLALAFAPRIKVNELALGAVLPPEGTPEAYIRTLREEIPLGRFPQAEEVGRALLFILTSASFTGQTLCIDGGRHLTWPDRSHER